MTTGFARPRPEIEIDESAAQAARAPLPANVRATATAAPVTAAPAPSRVTAPTGDRGASLAAVAAEIGACVKCGLSANRTMTVPGDGPLDPPVMFIGEAPGADEDRTAAPLSERQGSTSTRGSRRSG